MKIKKKDFDSQMDPLIGVECERLLTYKHDGDEMSVALTAVDRLACSFKEFHLNTGRLAAATIDDLKRISGFLKERVTYLTEHLELVETDPLAVMSQVRSCPPAVDDKVRTYYEVTIARGGYIRLVRYRKAPGEERQQISGELTREVTMRLMNDLLESIDPPAKKK